MDPDQKKEALRQSTPEEYILRDHCIEAAVPYMLNAIVNMFANIQQTQTSRPSEEKDIWQQAEQASVSPSPNIIPFAQKHPEELTPKNINNTEATILQFPGVSAESLDKQQREDQARRDAEQAHRLAA